MRKLLGPIVFVFYMLNFSIAIQAQDTETEAAREYLKIVNYHCSKNLLAECTITVQNLSKTQNIKDVEFLLEYYAPSGTQLGSDSQIAYEIFPANKKKTVKIQSLVHSQAQRVAISIFNPSESPNMVCELSELVMRNYLIGFEVGMCLWKRNVEFFIKQMNQWAAMQHLYNGTKDGLYGKSPSEIRALFESSFNELTKATTDFAQTNWPLLNDCINLMLDLD